MAASCRNLTCSTSEASFFSVFMATSTGPSGEVHTPFSTHPNCPEPRCSPILIQHYTTCIYSESVELDSLYVLSGNLSVSFISQLLINSLTIICWLPVISCFFKKGINQFLIFLFLKIMYCDDGWSCKAHFLTCVMLE